MSRSLRLEVLFNAVDRISGPIRTIIGGSQALTDSFKNTKNQLKDLEAQQRKITGFRQLTEQSQRTARAMAENQQRIQQLRESLRLNPASQEAVQALSRAEAAHRRLTNAHRSQRTELTSMVQGLNRAGISVDRLNDEESDLRNRIHLTTMEMNRQREALDRHAESQRRYERMQQRMAKANEMAKKGLAVSAVAIAGMGYSLKQYEDAEDAAMGLRVSMMQANGQVSKEYGEINKLANSLGTKLPGTTAEFQNMMAVLIQQGVSAKAILGGVGVAAGYLGVQMKMPFEEAAEFAAKMQDATKTAEKDMLSLMDVIQRSYYLGVDKGNMLQGFSKLSAGMKTIKQEGLEGAKAMAPLLVMADQAAMAGESAGNAFSKIFSSMMDTDGIKKALKDSKTGLTMNFTDGKGEFGGLDNMYKQLEQLKGLSTEQRLPILGDMFGNDAETIQALNLLIDKGKSGYDEVVAKMQAQADLQTRVNAQLSTLKNLKDAAGGTFTSLLALFGEKLAPQFKSMITGFTNITENVTAWAQKNPELAGSIARIVAGGALLIGGLSALSLGMITIFGPMMMVAKGFGVVAMAARAMNMTLLTNPITWIVLAIAGAAFLIYKNWAPISGFFSGIWDGIKTTFNGGINAITSAFSTGINYLKNIISGIDNVFANNPILNILLPFIGIPRMIINNWSGIQGFFGSVWSSIVTGASNTWNSIVGFFNPIGVWFSTKWEYVKQLTSVAWSGIKSIVSTAWDSLISVITNSPLFQRVVDGWTKIFEYLGSLKDRMLNVGRNIIDGLVNGIKSGFEELKGIWATINSYMPDFMRKKMDIRSPSRVMAGLGGHIVDGIGVGVNHKTPALQNQFSKTISVFDTSPAFGLTNSTTTPTTQTKPVKPINVGRNNPRSYISQDTIQVTIQVKDGSVVKGTAEAMRQELQRVAEEQQMKKRKFLTDTE
jgi:TP901 family phage tail tape measure protein